MKLSPHFSLEELCFSQTATRLGIENVPNAEALENLKRLCNEGLEPLRDFIKKPIVVSSGYRCLRLNTAIGSSSNSGHIKGLASDLRAIGMSTEQLMRAAIQSGIEWDQLIMEFVNSDGSGGWLHCAIAQVGKKPRGQHLVIDKTGTRFFE